jgi:hypothetical protein
MKRTMASHEESFKRFQNVAEIMALIGATEDLHLECKIWPTNENDAQKVLAKSLCGFANADGGVLVIGMEAKGGPNKDDPDVIRQGRPVTNAMAVKSRIENLVGQLVEPALERVQVEAVFDSPGSMSGFVLVDVPPTEGFPCRSRKDSKFYLRVSAGTFPMEYFQIADMFGKRRRPALKLYLKEESTIEPRNGVPTRLLTFGIENCGRAVAKFPTIRFRPGPLAVDEFGIDGNHGFGLPRLPSEPEWIVFGAGADQVIHPGTVLKIGRLEQRANRSEWQPVSSDRVALVFKEFTLNVQLAAEEFPNTADSSAVAEKDCLP